MNTNHVNFTTTQISRLIPVDFSTNVTLLIDSFPNSEIQILQSFEYALKLIAPLFIEPKPVVIIFGTSPFTIVTDTSKIIVEFINGTEQLTSGNKIFYDWQKLRNESQEFQVAVMLEELCHYFFNIRDEDLVRIVVCHVYSKVKWNGNEYEKI